MLGVSRDRNSLTARPATYAATLGSRPRVTVIKAAGPPELHGLPVCPSLADLDDRPDVAMVMVPADDVIPVLRQCVDAGVKGAVVISSGFEEGDGAARRSALTRFLHQNPHFRLIGPNCVGVTSPAADCWLTFSSVLLRGRPLSGTVGLVTQSGAVGNGLFLALQQRGAGLAHWVSTGNELDVGALEIAADMLRRPECDAVGLFLEGITDKECRGELAEVVAATGKPVVALRAAASEQGKRAAMGHTGRVIGRDEVARAALEEIGVVLVDSLDELTAALTVAAVAPRRANPRGPASVAVLTVSGATGVMAADEVARRSNLELAEFGGDVATAIAGSLPSVRPSDVANPLDIPVLGDSGTFERAIGEVVRTGVAEATVAVVSSLAHDYESISRTQEAASGPLVLAHLSPAEDFTPEQARRLAGRGVAVVRTPRDAIRALSVWAGATGRPAARDAGPAEVPLPSGLEQAGVTGTARLLGEAVGRRLTAGRLVRDAEEAVAFAHGHRDRGVVLKADGARIAHRADVGAVVVGLRGDDEVRQAFAEVAEVCAGHGDAVLAQAMADPGLELMVSVIRDPEVGVAALVRPGGSLVEIGTGSVVLTGLRRHWRPAMERSAAGAMLGGWRGGPPLDAEALYALLGDLVDAFTRRPGIELVECNPVIVHEHGASIVDLLSYHHRREGAM
nr:acetate--CoA ligase family protein [Sphaerisporangium rubeum]